MENFKRIWRAIANYQGSLEKNTRNISQTEQKIQEDNSLLNLLLLFTRCI
mgnify:FL=1